MKQTNKKKIEYPVKRFRMDKKTYKNLVKIKQTENKSWNLTLAELIKTYENSLRRRF